MEEEKERSGIGILEDVAEDKTNKVLILTEDDDTEARVNMLITCFDRALSTGRD
jgi:hypothetical protein